MVRAGCSVKVTGDTITDEQIRELRDSVLVHEADAATVHQMSQDALGNFHQERLTADAIWGRIDYARARCAEIWNARHGADS